MVSILTVDLSLRLLCPDISDLSSVTESTSDNQCLGTSNDTISVVKHLTLKRHTVKKVAINDVLPLKAARRDAIAN